MTETLAQRIDEAQGHVLARGLGFRLLSVDATAGTAQCRFAPGEAQCNGFGVVHGGVLVTLLDLSMTAAALGASGLASLFPTLEIKASFFAPARPGPIEGHGRVRRLGRGIAFLEAELRDAHGTTLAAATATARVVAHRGPGPGA